MKKIKLKYKINKKRAGKSTAHLYEGEDFFGLIFIVDWPKNIETYIKKWVKLKLSLDAELKEIK